jgi:choline dehydrogenase
MKISFISLALIAAAFNLYGDTCSPYRCQMSGNELEADIIVIGGGAAGCILMSELSADGHFSVIGIEGGANLTNDPAIEAVGLPAFLLAGTGKPKYFWPGWNQTLPMAGLNGRTSDWTTGMLLGGGSSINGLYYGRGSNAVYSRWEEVSGSSNWSLEHILETFEELENYKGLTITPDERGTMALSVYCRHLQCRKSPRKSYCPHVKRRFLEFPPLSIIMIPVSKIASIPARNGLSILPEPSV